MESKQLSWNEVSNPSKAKFEIWRGYLAEELMPYDMIPYLIEGRKLCVRFISGVGFQQINKVYILK